MAGSGLPGGTVTFLFTDVEGSTRLLNELGDAYADVLAEHRRVLRDAFARHGGVEVDTQGDAFFVAFARASDALAAAREAMDALEGPIRVRIGVHTGEPLLTDEGYVGIDVHRAARIAAAGHGGQILVSQSTRDLVGGDGLRDLGEHRLKDLSAPERIWQLGDAAFPPLTTLRRTSLPVQPTPFVGRARELEEVTTLLRSSRLLTLTGPGGSGKTRLALQAASEVADDYADGVWFVSLAALTDPAAIDVAVARALGVIDDLHDYLAQRKLLLVVDNVEHLLPEAARQIAALDANVLATSREPTHLSHEQEYEVPTLAPDEAVALFAQRARQLRGGFEPDQVVEALVRRLDGLPLAVELAAARIKVLTPREIHERLGESLDLLSAKGEDVPERQRTLRATIAWSFDLLADEERELFARLSVFAGSFDLAAAEAVAGADVEGLEALVDKSLVRATDAGRFFMLDTIRSFAAEQLRTSGREQALRRRHGLHYLDVTREAWDAMASPAVREALARIDTTWDNAAAALDWAREEDLAIGLELAAILAVATRRQSARLLHLRRWLADALARPVDVSAPIRVRALRAYGFTLLHTNEYEHCRRIGEEALELARSSGDTAEEARALVTLGGAYWALGHEEEAVRFRTRSLELFRLLGDRPGTTLALHLLGETMRDLGRFGEAEEYLTESLALSREIGDTFFGTHTVHSLGDLALDRGDVGAAARRYDEALAVFLDFSDDAGMSNCYAGLASVAARLGDVRAAGALWGIVERIETQRGFRMVSPERARYERVLEAVTAEDAFERGRAAAPVDPESAAAIVDTVLATGD